MGRSVGWSSAPATPAESRAPGAGRRPGALLYEHWARARKAKVYHGINLAPVGGWPDKNYRVPDLVLLTPERFSIDRNEYFEGPPDVVVEIHTPGDEAYEKLRFYTELGVPEVCIIHRENKEREIYL